MTPRDLNRLLTDPTVRAVTRWNEEDAVRSDNYLDELRAEVERVRQDAACLPSDPGILFWDAVWESDDMPMERKAFWLHQAAQHTGQQVDALAAALRALVGHNNAGMRRHDRLLIGCTYCGELTDLPATEYSHSADCPIAVGRRLLADLDS